jgi:hypothetical protein
MVRVDANKSEYSEVYSVTVIQFLLLVLMTAVCGAMSRQSDRMPDSRKPRKPWPRVTSIYS